jgi:pyruvate dehydrogenase E2 component (dihydrolipoamide acetyltransferase)
MATEITMPKLSDTMTDGRFIGWRKSVGERIERGEVIAEVETDKAVMELEAFASGILLKTMATGGETVAVGTVLGLIGEPGEVPAEASATTAPAPPPESAVETAPPEPTASPVIPSPAPESAASPAASSPHPDEGHEKASPLVRHMAREAGIDLGQVRGSGPEGRVLQADLDAWVAAHGTGKALPGTVAPEPPAAPKIAPEPSEAPPTSAMRQAISATVTRSWHEIPHFTVTVEIDMRACSEMVRELKGGSNGVGYNALVIKGCATALGRFPRLNAAAGPGIHVGFAVALDDGLLVPVIRGCELLSPREIEAESARLADRARNGRLTQAELSGGGFTVSNLGMYGVDEFTALIVPGQVAVLAVGAVTERPAVRDGKVVVIPSMRVTLSADHRTVDGAHAAAFLVELRRILEQPLPLFL